MVIWVFPGKTTSSLEADRTRFLLVEHWNSREGWQGHREEIPFTEIYQPKVLPLVDREPHICELIE